jgi:hypothetical protein
MRFLGEWHNALNAHDGSHVHEPDAYPVEAPVTEKRVAARSG